MAKLNFQQLLLQSSVSHDLSWLSVEVFFRSLKNNIIIEHLSNIKTVFFKAKK